MTKVKYFLGILGITVLLIVSLFSIGASMFGITLLLAITAVKVSDIAHSLNTVNETLVNIEWYSDKSLTKLSKVATKSDETTHSSSLPILPIS